MPALPTLAGFTVKFAFTEMAPEVAVTTAACVLTGVPAVAVKDALNAPDATVTLAGTVTQVLFDDNATVKALTAALFKVTVQVLLPPPVTAAGLQASNDTPTGASNVSVTESEDA